MGGESARFHLLAPTGVFLNVVFDQELSPLAAGLAGLFVGSFGDGRQVRVIRSPGGSLRRRGHSILVETDSRTETVAVGDRHVVEDIRCAGRDGALV